MSLRLVPFDTERETLADGSVRISAHGELDLATASALDAALRECSREAPTRLVVDLSDVPFIDAAGLRVLIAARRRQDEASGELVIASPSRQVARLLQIAGERANLRVVNEKRRFAA